MTERLFTCDQWCAYEKLSRCGKFRDNILWHIKNDGFGWFCTIFKCTIITFGWLKMFEILGWLK